MTIFRDQGEFISRAGPSVEIITVRRSSSKNRFIIAESTPPDLPNRFENKLGIFQIEQIYYPINTHLLLRSDFKCSIRIYVDFY